jgi:hypothetical protein
MCCGAREFISPRREHSSVRRTVLKFVLLPFKLERYCKFVSTVNLLLLFKYTRVLAIKNLVVDFVAG